MESDSALFYSVSDLPNRFLWITSQEFPWISLRLLCYHSAQSSEPAAITSLHSPAFHLVLTQSPLFTV